MAAGTWCSRKENALDKTFIKDLLVRGIIGIRDWERQKAQDILINITVFSDMRRAAETDDIAYCIDYSALTKLVQAHAETAARLTVEALAQDLAGICLAQNGVQRVIVRVEKPGAVRFAKSVGVEIERSKND
jgi:FolB domain-containing protein